MSEQSTSASNSLDSIESYAEWVVLGGGISALLMSLDGRLPNVDIPIVQPTRKKHRSANVYTHKDRANSTFSMTYLFPPGTDSPLLNENSSRAKKFRRRFRVPYQIFQSICNGMKTMGLYLDGTDAKGEPKIQLELLVFLNPPCFLLPFY